MAGTHFVTFGSATYAKTLERIKYAAYAMGCFDSINVYKEEDLDSNFRVKHGKFIQDNRRGYGYWIWKPQVILQTMKSVRLGEYIVYADAGCDFKCTPATINRFREYIDNTNDILVFHLDDKPEYCWTKMDTICQVHGKQVHVELLTSPQIIATVIFFKNTEWSQQFVQEWLDICSRDNYRYITDEASSLPNIMGFREHRHDQSIFSLLVKKYWDKSKCKSIKDETYDAEGNWHAQDWPIHAARIRM